MNDWLGRIARSIGPVFLTAAAACAGSARSQPDSPPPAEEVRLADPLPIRVGVTAAEGGPLTEALVRRLRAANLFTQVFYPLESSSEMDAALEIQFHRQRRAKTSAIEVLTMGMSGTNRFEETVEGIVVVKVGAQSVQEFRARSTLQIESGSPGELPRAAVEKAETAAGPALAAKLVEPMVRDPGVLAAAIQAAAATADGRKP
jgi:hypothetical protein